MPKFKFESPYTISQEEIKEKVNKGVQKFGANVDWKNENECHFSGEYKGIKVSGSFVIKDEVVDIAMNLPLAAKPFQGKIKEKVIEELNK